MLPFTVHGSGDITLILLPFLGGSQREWTETIEPLSKQHRCITIDLPGFGEAANIPGYSVAEMADAIIDVLKTLNLDRYLLIGHSMAGKLVGVMTRQIVDGKVSLKSPIGLILVAPSPPGVEPMSDSKRSQMLEAFADKNDLQTETIQEQAEKYIKDNSSRVIPRFTLDRTIEDVLKMNVAAWNAWLTEGSKEDWSDRVGVLTVPTLILAGEDDSALGPAAQTEHTLPHFPESHMIAVSCNHLLPLEQPAEVAALISNFIKVF